MCRVRNKWGNTEFHKYIIRFSSFSFVNYLITFTLVQKLVFSERHNTKNTKRHFISFKLLSLHFLACWQTKKLLKVTISFVMPVRPFVCPPATRLPLDGFLWNLIFGDFSKNCRENSCFVKIWQELRAHFFNNYVNLWYIVEFSSE
jgi:hypothetical protein